MQSTAFKKHVAPGVYQVKETGGVITASLHRLLADGSMLSAPENGHLLATIDAIILAEYPAAPSTLGQQGASIPGLVSNFGLLVQWMKAHDLHYFGHLTDVDLRRFLIDSSCGLDAVLDSQNRLRTALADRALNRPLASKDFAQVLPLAGIPPTQSVWLPAARKMFDSFINSGKIPAVEVLQPKQVTNRLLWGRAKVFQLLWRHRKNVPDGLTFEPSIADIAKQIKAHSKPVGSTRTLPVDFTCNLVGLAFTWVYEYGPLLADLQRVLAHHRPGTSSDKLLAPTLERFNAIAMTNGWALRLQTIREKPKADHVSWQLATTTFLPVACFILCGIFTARRISELVSLRPHSLNGSLDTGYWLSNYVGKRAKQDNFPCTRSVADCIRALAALMKLRAIDERQSIFSAIRGKGRLGNRLRNALARFGRLVKSGLPAGQTQWQLAAHQLRRMFALIYRWRYDHPVLIALSVYLGHVSLKHLEAYTNSPEWICDNLEAGKQFTLEKLRDIALGKVEPKGILGKSLKRAIARSLAQVELADENEQEAALVQLVDDRQLDLRATLWGYCGAKSAHSNLRRARCSTPDVLRSKATIDPEKSSEEKCAGCLFFGTDVSRRIHWVKKTERLRTAAAAAPEGTMAKRKIQERLQVVERFTRNNFQQPPANEKSF